MSRRPGCAFGIGIALVIYVSLVAAGTGLLTAVWPGSFELTAPLLCPDDSPDSLVVRDTYSVRPGETSTTFTLYCLSERGEVTDVGAMRPVLIVAAVVAIVIGGLMLVAMLALGRSARRSGTGKRGQGQDPGAGYVPTAVPDVLQVNLVDVSSAESAPAGEVFPTPPDPTASSDVRPPDTAPDRPPQP
jgi:hypothetical protein